MNSPRVRKCIRFYCARHIKKQELRATGSFQKRPVKNDPKEYSYGFKLILRIRKNIAFFPLILHPQRLCIDFFSQLKSI